MALAAGWGTLAYAAELPEVAVPQCPAPPHIDGRLDDEAWKTAACLSPFYVFPISGDHTDMTQARAIRDAQWLYLGMECRNPGMRHLRPSIVQRDGPVHTDDSVEIFLDRGTATTTTTWCLASPIFRQNERFNAGDATTHGMCPGGRQRRSSPIGGSRRLPFPCSWRRPGRP